MPNDPAPPPPPAEGTRKSGPSGARRPHSDDRPNRAARRSALVALALATLASAAVASFDGVDAILLDGFESGDPCGWSARSPLYVQEFDLVDGSALPAPFAIAGGLVEAGVESGRARLRAIPSPIAPGRVVAPIATRDAEARFDFTMEDVSRQGIGFYVRQNGGWLHSTTPPGEGYSVFVEGFTGVSQIGLWRERDGNEEAISRVPLPFSFLDGATYRVRFRARNVDTLTTRLDAKTWDPADPEPEDWDVTVFDALSTLQGTTAGIAIDAYTLNGAPDMPTATIDDLVVDWACELPAP